MNDALGLFESIFNNNQANPAGTTFGTFGNVMGLGLNILMGVSFTLALIATIVSGIQFVMSQGDPKAIDTAKRYLTAAVIAMVLTLSAFTIKIIILNATDSNQVDLRDETPSF